MLFKLAIKQNIELDIEEVLSQYLENESWDKVLILAHLLSDEIDAWGSRDKIEEVVKIIKRR